jgi:outer membrane autotransporter protein
MTHSTPLQSSLRARPSRGTAFAGKGKQRFAPSALVLALSAALAMPGVALASDWVGTTSSDWFTGGNWSTPVGVPTNASNVFVDTAIPNLALINGGNADAQTITIGNAAGSNGTLAIVNGGTLNNVVGTIGGGPNAAGTVTVTGAGSTWTSASDLSIGENGSGTLTISNGGTVNNAFGLVANQAGSSGTVLVDGATWANTADLLVGVGGSGALTIQNGGKVDNTHGIIASQPNTVGIVAVTGVGSTWTSSGNLSVGSGGNGTLAIAAGAVVSNVDGHVGVGGGASGAVTVDGGGSTWTNTGNLTVGEGGTGSLGITNGGTVNVGNDGSIGDLAGATGTVSVGGATSTLSYTGGLLVGKSGSGTLAISGGGKVSNDSGIVGMMAGGTGTATVDGAGSSWTSGGSLIVGFLGNGNLAITNGGAVTANFGDIASAAGTTGTVTVTGTGSSLTTVTSLTVGEMGTGFLAVSQGGAVNSVGGIVGTAGTGTGTVTVDGAGSAWTNSSDLFVGLGGTGTLAITNGGKVSNAIGTIGELAGSTGSLAIDGQGSTWTSDYLIVGNNGTGSLAITNGGVAVVNANGGMAIAESAGSTGHVAVDGAGSALNIGGNLSVGASGTGTLAITRGGSLSTAVAWVGDFPGAIGTVTVDGAGSVWNNSGDLYVGRGAAVGVLTISNGGLVSVGGKVGISTNAGSTGTINIGGAVGAAPAAPGTLVAVQGIDLGGFDPAINFNHTDTSGNYTFDAVISGVGTINQNAGSTSLTADSSGFNGRIDVNGGRLAVNGLLTGDNLLNVNSGGTLGGAGTVANIQAHAGGIVAPGNSIGTLNVKYDANFATGSIYQVEVNPAGQSDKLAVEGVATLSGGTVQVLAGAGTYAPATRYNILTAQGGVTGTFAGATSSLVFLDPSLSYDPKNVYLTLTRNANSFASIAQTANQNAAGTAAEALGTGNAIFDAMLKLSAPQARNAFDQVSGEVHASARGVQLQDSHFVRDASLERLRAMDSERVANDGGADPEEGKPTRLLPSVRDLAYWARAMGSWGHTDGDGNAATVKRDTSGFLMGADTRFGEQGRFGLMGGYSRSAFDVSDRNSSGSSENYHLGAYAGSRFGDLALRTGISYSWHDVSTSRAVAFPGFTDSLKADYKANTTQAFAELGYRIKTERAELEPFANLALVNVSSDGFTERGGPAALTSAGNSSGVTFSTVGLRASTSFAMDNGTSVTARGSLGWRNASGDVTPTTSLAFAGGLPFAVAGAPIAKSAAVVEAGLDFKLTNAATLGLSYGGQFGSGLKDHSARVNLNVAF